MDVNEQQQKSWCITCACHDTHISKYTPVWLLLPHAQTEKSVATKRVNANRALYFWGTDAVAGGGDRNGQAQERDCDCAKNRVTSVINLGMSDLLVSTEETWLVCQQHTDTASHCLLKNTFEIPLHPHLLLLQNTQSFAETKQDLSSVQCDFFDLTTIACK